MNAAELFLLGAMAVVAIGGTLVLIWDEAAKRFGPAIERWWKQ